MCKDSPQPHHNHNIYMAYYGLLAHYQSSITYYPHPNKQANGDAEGAGEGVEPFGPLVVFFPPNGGRVLVVVPVAARVPGYNQTTITTTTEATQ